MSDEAFYRDVVRHAPRMTSLLGAEFNFDWRLDWPDVESVLVQDVDDADLAGNQELQTELDYLLSALETEALADAFLVHVDSGLDPLADTGESTRSWLIKVRERVRRNTASLGDLDQRDQLGGAV
ncbi:contact-dependent growth inhibition system immunity protein [Curtobacterium sp. MCBA15_008]|uniref:contact-dependent growth inhibition system immunity protein n=1 Tax=Curtobacterium sp. MCBA15_008 TaxID=1898736 RepID=UPI0011136F40|nr:contact-dependent growth inhibition system immunity protein [Curtobacterium sp. MCBA15_008]